MFSNKIPFEKASPSRAKCEPRFLVVLRAQKSEPAFGLDCDFGYRTIVYAAAHAVPLGPRVRCGIGDRNIRVVIFISYKDEEFLTCDT